MTTSLPTKIFLVILLTACASSKKTVPHKEDPVVPGYEAAALQLPAELKPSPLTDLARNEDGGFVLRPGYYETEFKTYCLQPGTPDPRSRDAYLQAPITGYRKEIVQNILQNSRSKPEIKQRNVQLLLWSVVSGSNFDKLSYEVQGDAAKLLTPRQVFELRGGVIGVIKTVSNHIPSGIINGNNDIVRLFEAGANSYEMFERAAVLQEPSKIRKADFKNDQWYKQQDQYYIRYFPISYQKVKIQVFVPESNNFDSTGKFGDDYMVF